MNRSLVLAPLTTILVLAGLLAPAGPATSAVPAESPGTTLVERTGTTAQRAGGCTVRRTGRSCTFTDPRGDASGASYATAAELRRADLTRVSFSIKGGTLTVRLNTVGTGSRAQQTVGLAADLGGGRSFRLGSSVTQKRPRLLVDNGSEVSLRCGKAVRATRNARGLHTLTAPVRCLPSGRIRDITASAAAYRDGNPVAVDNRVKGGLKFRTR